MLRVRGAKPVGPAQGGWKATSPNCAFAAGGRSPTRFDGRMQMTRIGAVLLLLAAALPAQWREPTATQLVVPPRTDAPALACTAAELQRLRAALAHGDKPVADRVAAARQHLGQPLDFPPRGGQHNQWYQCDKCQLALTTVDPTHHRCTKCGVVYSGPPYDDVVFSRVHGQNLRRGLDAAWAFALTGEPAFAADAKAVLLGYAARYENYPYHCNAADPQKPSDSGGHLMEQTLSEASMLAGQIAPAIDLLWPALGDDERQQLLQHLVLPMLKNIDKCKRGKSNWQSWHNAAMFAGGVLLGDAGWLQKAVLGRGNGFCWQMEHCVSAEGMWYENSFGYHLYTLDAMVRLADAARVCGIDLFDCPELKNMTSLPGRYLMADGHLPRFGDDVESTLGRAAYAMETSYAATGDAALLPALPTKPSFDSLRCGRDVAARVEPPWQSELFEDAGHAILRTGGAMRGSALLTFAPFGGFHGHFDKLSFVWHAFGVERGVDPGRAASQAYRLPIHGGWYRATLAHNAVVVDGHSQRGAGGDLLGFVAGDGFSAVAARSQGAYPGVDHRRCLVLGNDWLVVLDLLQSPKAHDYDWIYHDAGDEVVSADARGEPQEPLGLDGEEFVQWHKAGKTEGSVAVRFAGKPVSTRLWLAAGGATEVRTGAGPFRSAVERAPMVLLRRRGRDAQFAAVLTASTAAAPSVVTGIRCVDGEKGITVAIERGAGREVLHWDGAGVVERR